MEHEVALAHAVTRIKEGLPTDRVVAELVGMGASDETARDVVDQVLAVDAVAPSARPPRQAKRALAVVEAPPDPRRFEDVLMLLQPLWVRAGQRIAPAAFCIAVFFGGFATLAKTPKEWTHTYDAYGNALSASPPASPVRQRSFLEVGAYLGIACSVLWTLASAGLRQLRSSALSREVNEWYRHAQRGGAARVELYKDRLVLRGRDVPWSAVSDAAEVESNGIPLIAVRAQGAWEILPADAFKKGDLTGVRSLMSRKLDRKVRVVDTSFWEG